MSFAKEPFRRKQKNNWRWMTVKVVCIVPGLYRDVTRMYTNLVNISKNEWWI